jgi:hypothetical protein
VQKSRVPQNSAFFNRNSAFFVLLEVLVWFRGIYTGFSLVWIVLIWLFQQNKTNKNASKTPNYYGSVNVSPTHNSSGMAATAGPTASQSQIGLWYETSWFPGHCPEAVSADL